ncbi:hypothetical protein GX48_07648 [Paracoccidioides brasiliensis]|nr:hypothetical protein GX48_07648 [Paracoccidioides brasiliensis]
MGKPYELFSIGCGRRIERSAREEWSQVRERES